jgi:hypothetical protein
MSDQALDMDIENHNFDDTISSISSTMFASREDAERAMGRHVANCDNGESRTFNVIPFNVCQETKHERGDRIVRESAERLLCQYYTHEVSHLIKTIVEHKCRGCQSHDLSYRRHDCRDDSAYDRVKRHYESAWSQLPHQGVVDQWTSDCLDNDVYAEVSEVFYWKYHVGTSFRKRWTTRRFHVNMQLTVENHIRLSEMPSLKSRIAASSRMGLSGHRPAEWSGVRPTVADQLASLPPAPGAAASTPLEVAGECGKVHPPSEVHTNVRKDAI